MALISCALETFAHALGTRGSPEPCPQGGRIWSHNTRGATEPSQLVRSNGTCGGAEAVLIRVAGSRAAGHMATLEPTSTEGQGPVLEDTWQRVGAHPAPYLGLKLVCSGTDSGF
jgi:hypothetical protein